MVSNEFNNQFFKKMADDHQELVDEMAQLAQASSSNPKEAIKWLNSLGDWSTTFTARRRGRADDRATFIGLLDRAISRVKEDALEKPYEHQVDPFEEETND